MKGTRSARLWVLCGIAVLMLAATAWLRFGTDPGKGPSKRRAPRARTPDAVSLRPWSPPQAPPEPREILTGDGWTRRLKELIAEADLRDGAKPYGPPFSLHVTEVFEGSQARRLGIRPGDRMVEYDGAPILGVQAFNLQRIDRPGRLK